MTYITAGEEQGYSHVHMYMGTVYTCFKDHKTYSLFTFCVLSQLLMFIFGFLISVRYLKKKKSFSSLAPTAPPELPKDQQKTSRKQWPLLCFVVSIW